MAIWSLQDAETRFGAVVTAAKVEAQTVVEDGQPTVVVLNASEYARLKRIEEIRKPTLADSLLAMPTRDSPPDLPPLPFKARPVAF